MQEACVGIKELYDVNIRATAPIDLGNKRFNMNESLLLFRRAELSTIQEEKNNVLAKGGYHNNIQINWETDKGVLFAISHGILSPTSWSILSNSLIEERQYKSIQYEEDLHAELKDDYCFITLKFKPNCINGKIGAQGNPYNESMPMGRRNELMLKPIPPKRDRYIFFYDRETGQRIDNYFLMNNQVFFNEPHKFIYADYTFDYYGNILSLDIGQRLWNGFLRLTAKLSMKEKNNGKVKTGIIEIPKIKLNSSLNITLGKSYEDSTISDFYFVGYPDDSEPIREKQKVFTIDFLDLELTGDYI